MLAFAVNNPAVVELITTVHCPLALVTPGDAQLSVRVPGSGTMPTTGLTPTTGVKSTPFDVCSTVTVNVWAFPTALISSCGVIRIRASTTVTGPSHAPTTAPGF